MTDFAADSASSSTGATLTARTGTTSGDTVPAGSYVVWRNTGAGSHVVTLTNSATNDGLAVANRTHTIAAGAVRGARINPAWGDANGRVAQAIDGTANEITYYIVGGI